MSEWRLKTDRCNEELTVENSENFIYLHMKVGDNRISHSLTMFLKPHDAREFAQALLASAESMEQMRKAKP